MIEFHGVDTTTLSHGAEIRDVTEHVGERDLRSDDLSVGFLDHTFDRTTAGRNIAHDGTDIVDRSGDVRSDDRL